MNKYLITIKDEDDWNEFEIELTDEEYKAILKVSNMSIERSKNWDNPIVLEIYKHSDELGKING